MDIKTVSRHYPRIIATSGSCRQLLFVAIFAASLALLLTIHSPAPAHAQNGICPDDTSSLPNPHGTYPQSSALCSGSDDMELYSWPELSCGQGIKVENGWAWMEDISPITVVPPADMSFPGQAWVSFELTVDYVDPTGTLRLIPEIIIESYNSGGYLLGTAHLTSPMTIREVESDVLGMGYAGLVAASQGGYFRFHPVSIEPSHINRFYYSGIVISNSGWQLPGTCYGYDLPTPTPTPSPTPSVQPTTTATPYPTPTGTLQPTTTPQPTTTATATGQPTATSTLWPTAPPATASPVPTGTPMINPTVNIPTPTPLSDSPALPTIQLPSLSLDADFSTPFPFSVALTPNATAQARHDDIATRTASGMIIVTRWYTTTSSVIAALDPSLTTTSVISSPVQIAETITQNVAAPLRYVRAIHWMMPHSWLFVLFLIVMVIWIFFILFVKFGLAVIGDVADAIRKVIELIPGM